MAPHHCIMLLPTWPSGSCAGLAGMPVLIKRRRPTMAPHHYASANCHQAVVQCMLDAGADKEKAANDAATTLQMFA